MPLSNTLIQECLRATGEFLTKRRPLPEIRDKVDIRANIKRQDVTVFSVRPAYSDPRRKTEYPLAEARWVGTRKVWKLYWMRADEKWHSYKPFPESPSIARLLAEVDRDPHGCFFG